MGSLLDFRRPNRVPPRAVFGLGTTLVERDAPRGARAILEIDGLAIFCVVAEMPVVDDVVHGDVTAIVEKVRVTSEGHVVIEGRRATHVLPEMRRRRCPGDSRYQPTDDVPRGA